MQFWPWKRPVVYISKYFVWLPSPLLMACRLLVRDTMVFIRNFICPNYLQNIILQKSLLLLVFRPCNFDPALSKLLQWFRSTGLLRVSSEKKLSSDKFFSPKSLTKFVSIISWAGHKYNKNLRVLPKKNCPVASAFLFLGEIACQTNFLSEVFAN